MFEMKWKNIELIYLIKFTLYKVIITFIELDIEHFVSGQLSSEIETKRNDMEEVKRAFAVATSLFESKMSESLNRCEVIKKDSNQIINSTNSKIDSIESNNQKQIDNLVELGNQQTSYITQVLSILQYIITFIYSV